MKRGKEREKGKRERRGRERGGQEREEKREKGAKTGEKRQRKRERGKERKVKRGKEREGEKRGGGKGNPGKVRVIGRKAQEDKTRREEECGGEWESGMVKRVWIKEEANLGEIRK